QIEGEGATSLIEVAECYARLGQFRKARQVVKRCSSHERLEAAAAVLTEYAVDTGLSQKFQFGVPMSESIPPSPPGP
ncbi:MAG TPA: hypothetical protein VD994_09880, partial [Prosthecobacter sp.]|nr:hypothetical protein [Prosthecobacter sp.]